MAKDVTPSEATLHSLAAGSLRGLSEPIESYSKIQLFYLLRIVDLRNLRAQWIGVPDAEWRVKLIDRALFSCYRAACNLGLSADARYLLTDADANSNN